MVNTNRQPSNTILRPPWLNVARAAWVICAITAVAFFALNMGQIKTNIPQCTTANAACSPWDISQEDFSLATQLGWPTAALYQIQIFVLLLPRLAFFVVGILIFWYRSDDWMAQMLSLMLMLMLVEGLENLGPWMPVIYILYTIATAIFLFLPFVFPDGHFAPAWIKWWAWPLIVISVIGSLLPILPVNINETIVTILLLAPMAIWFFVGGYAAVYRYQNLSNTIEKQQTKWVLAGILSAIILIIPFTIISIAFPPSQPTAARLVFVFAVFSPLYLLSYLFIPTAIMFAILRYRLWDIDIIIRRTVQYSLITAVLAAVYLGSVVVLQQLFVWLTGSESAVAIVLSTLAIAALFTPLRQRVQTSVDRRFFRPRYDPAQVLATFAQTTKEETDVTQLTAELEQIIQHTLQPNQVTIWLTPTRNR